ncbi:hypothetical protein E2C01_089858 [Portunus trituberculatus]|uniref:Uncharacterized protein n=1 Tax=Portunus trituberculatus TaxID=210409 RepID=A0A5B7JIM2_PORTR|nr:hypothetical protein [Portunus trituberculatus]
MARVLLSGLMAPTHRSFPHSFWITGPRVSVVSKA